MYLVGVRFEIRKGPRVPLRIVRGHSAMVHLRRFHSQELFRLEEIMTLG